MKLTLTLAEATELFSRSESAASAVSSACSSKFDYDKPICPADPYVNHAPVATIEVTLRDGRVDLMCRSTVHFVFTSGQPSKYLIAGDMLSLDPVKDLTAAPTRPQFVK